MTTLEVLEKARDRIRDPKDWKQNGLGPLAGYGPVCAMGALKETICGMACGGSVSYMELEKLPATRALGAPIEGGRIAKFNDTHTHAEVLELFNLAIAAELVKEQETGCPISDTSTSSRLSPVPA